MDQWANGLFGLKFFKNNKIKVIMNRCSLGWQKIIDFPVAPLGMVFLDTLRAHALKEEVLFWKGTVFKVEHQLEE